MSRFNRQLWQRFWAIAKPYWFSEEKWGARALLVLMLLFSLAATGLNVILTYQQGEFFSALAAKDTPRFLRSIFIFLGVIVAAVPVIAFVGYVYLVFLLPAMVVAPRYFNGEIELGVINQAQSAFAEVLGALLVFVEKLQQLSQFAAGVNRWTSEIFRRSLAV